MNTLQRKAPIVLLDSGAGGIGVLREVKKLLPREQLIYFGDRANAPYGERDEEEVRRLVLSAAARWLPCAKALLLACNTATAAAADALRQRYPTVPIIGMEPALLPALRISKHPKVAVLATAATLRSQKFRNLMKMHAKSAHVWQISAPGIVRLVEKGRADSPEMDAYLRSLLAPLPTLPDAVVLGCTHFPFAKPSLARVLGGVPCFDGAAGTARELKRRLQALELETDTPGTGGILLTSSDPTALPLFSRLLSQSNA